MKRAAFAIALFVAGCGPTTPTIDEAAIDAVVAQVKGHTIEICQYLPTNETVVNIITASSPVIEGAYNIAKAICDAVTADTGSLMDPAQMGTSRAGDKTTCPMVNGVCIEGQWINKTKPEETH